MFDFVQEFLGAHQRYIEYFILLIGFCWIWRVLRVDKLLARRVLVVGVAFALLYMGDFPLLHALMLVLTPALLVVFVLVHYTTIARLHLNHTQNFIGSCTCRTSWINDLIKLHLYAHHQKKKITIYCMKHDAAYTVFAHEMLLDSPIHYALLGALVRGNDEGYSLLIDKMGHIRSINPQPLDIRVAHLGETLYFEFMFDEHTKSFTIKIGEKYIRFLSATHATKLISELFDSSTTPSSLMSSIPDNNQPGASSQQVP